MLFYIATNKEVLSHPPDQKKFDKLLNDRSHWKYIDFNTTSILEQLDSTRWNKITTLFLSRKTIF